MPSIINSTTTAGLSVQADNSGSLQLATNNGTTAVTIDTSQNVGVGTSTPTVFSGYKTLSVNGTTNGGVLELKNADVSTGLIFCDSQLLTIRGQTSTPIVFQTNGSTERGRFDTSGNFLFNSGYGSVATAYGCRAWVNFNGTGTVAIRASGNVSSITDLGVGIYQVNFTSSLTDANYSAVVTPTRDGTATGCLFSVIDGTSSLFKIVTRATSETNVDCGVVSVSVFR
jgi:hypothetical protein